MRIRRHTSSDLNSELQQEFMTAMIADYGVILAGGRGRRMGETNKALLQLGDRSLIQWVVDTARPQVGELLLSVNRDPQAYAHLSLRQFPDYRDGYSGPLLGIVSAMREMRTLGKNDAETLLACFPADVPVFPNDIVARLIELLNQSGADLSLVQTGAQLQPLFSVWKLSSLPQLEKAVDEGLAGPKLVLPRLHSVTLETEAQGAEFMNINSPEDLIAVRETCGLARPD